MELFQDIDLKTKQSFLRKAGFLLAAGNASSSRLSLMTLDTQMTLTLLQEMLIALRANDADG